MTMIIRLFITLFISLASFAEITSISESDGSDGACNFSGTLIAQTYNCTTVQTSGPINVTGVGVLIIKAQGDVIINHDLNLSGADGENGSQTVFPTTGGVAISGGFDGGSCVSTLFCDPQDGEGPGAGLAGEKGNGIIDITEAGGGAGGSGPYQAAGSAGNAGAVTDGVTSAGLGGATTVGDYLEPTELQQTLQGGSGGGAGGGATNGIAQASGGAGGAGGGAIQISSYGTVTINASIIVDGGDGGSGIVVVGETSGSGGGGGGSGGVIFIEAAKHIVINGHLYARHGEGGLGAQNALGGDGGSGLIRLDDQDGVVNSSRCDPSPTLFISDAPNLPPDEENNKSIFHGGYTCGTISDDNDQSGRMILSFLFGIFLIGLTSKLKNKLNS